MTAMGQPRRTEPHLGQFQAKPFTQQHVFDRHLQPIEDQLAMAAMLLWAHDRNTPLDPPAGIVPIKQKRRQPAAAVIRGPGDQDEMLRNTGPGDKPLAPGDHIAIAPLVRACLDHAGVRTATRRGFGHGKGRPNLTLGDGAQPAILLLVRRRAFQHHHVAVVGRGRVETDRQDR